ncbi:hypothetical protein AMATHDRAFT_5284 [Amanita thiersii Skay4041]|uniref:Uncharacterized protein n=1 Tax=Amanita thiersii Skay4041 TaxID=703135 RepID=A0A2A9NMX4_9AGAR|nr:hypothetical protein AMATHDRAFT_5284 [Amanita thiersii Skay4041]
MDDIEYEVRHLDKTIASMSARRDKLIVQLDRCIIALAPYKKLPVDVLQHIFTLFSFTGDDSIELRSPFLRDLFDPAPKSSIQPPAAVKTNVLQTAAVPEDAWDEWV